MNDDNIFLLKDKLKDFNFEIKYIKNPSRGPSSSIKQGFKSGDSECVIVYPADDFLNINISIKF